MNDANQVVINKLINQITEGLSDIMDASYPHCKNSDINVSKDASKINNIAFELKRMSVLLQNQINFIKQ